MKCENGSNLVIIIDPWQQPWWVQCLFFLDVARKLYLRIKKFLHSRNDINDVIIASYKTHKKVDFRIYTIKKNLYHITDENIFLDFLDKRPYIENVIITGLAWESCVRSRPLGYENLYKILKYRNIGIYIKEDCILTYADTQFIEENNPDWMKSSTPGFYKYAPLYEKIN